MKGVSDGMATKGAERKETEGENAYVRGAVDLFLRATSGLSQEKARLVLRYDNSGDKSVEVVSPYLTEGDVRRAMDDALDAIRAAVEAFNAGGGYRALSVAGVEFVVGESKGSIKANVALHPEGDVFYLSDMGPVANYTATSEATKAFWLMLGRQPGVRVDDAYFIHQYPSPKRLELTMYIATHDQRL